MNPAHKDEYPPLPPYFATICKEHKKGTPSNWLLDLSTFAMKCE
jgi:hypothetical protein